MASHDRSSAHRLNAGPTALLHLNFIEGDNYNVTGSTGNTFGGRSNTNTIVPDPSSFSKGFDLLTQNSAFDAFHDSGFAADPTKCHPETRTAILADLENWAESEDDYPFKWVKGSAGVGKTVIMRTTAETLAKKKLLLASFFFWRTGLRCSTTLYFVATIAYQICQALPACKPLIARAVEADPHIFSRQLEAQIQVLLVDPIAAAYRGGPRVIMIDGLDECVVPGTQSPDAEKQCQILRVVHSTVQQLRQFNIPIVILIASRPESYIQSAFDDLPQSSVSSTFLNDSYDATADIRRFYEEKFRDIRRPYPHLRNWPSTQQVSILVSRASGQFIYASTIMQFVKAGNPSKQLALVLNVQERSAMRPLQRLDLLYQTILSHISEEDWAMTLGLLQILFADMKFATRSQFPDFWEAFFGWEQGEIRRLSRGLGSVLAVPYEDTQLDQFRFYHASFQEFLFDRSRSETFYIDQDLLRGHIFRLCVHHLSTRDDHISRYLGDTMDIWSWGLNPTEELVNILKQGGFDVYPPNLAAAFPAFLLCIEESGMEDLYWEKWDLYLAQLRDVLEQYFMEDALAYLVFASAAGSHTEFLVLGSLQSVNAPAGSRRFDDASLKLNAFRARFLMQSVLRHAIQRIVDDIPGRDDLYARAAAVFVKLLKAEENLLSPVTNSRWSSHHSTSDYNTHELGGAANTVMRYLLQHATPLHSLSDCINDLAPITFPGMRKIVAEYVRRIDQAGSEPESSDSGLEVESLELGATGRVTKGSVRKLVRFESDISDGDLKGSKTEPRDAEEELEGSENELDAESRQSVSPWKAVSERLEEAMPEGSNGDLEYHVPQNDNLTAAPEDSKTRVYIPTAASKGLARGQPLKSRVLKLWARLNGKGKYRNGSKAPRERTKAS